MDPMSACPPVGATVGPGDFDLYVGMDVDKRSIAVTFVDGGTLQRSHKMPYDAANLLGHVRRHYPGRTPLFGYEAGPTGYGLHDALQAAGQRCLVVAPQSVPEAKGNQVKTNRRDSVQMAVSLRGDMVEGIRVPAGAYRELRHLVGLRNLYAKQAQGHMFRIKGLLLLEGLAFPAAPAGSQWSKRVVSELRCLECTPAVRFKLDSLLDSLRFAREQRVRAHRQIRLLLKTQPDMADSVRYLMSLPGVGWVIAYNVLARVGDWRALRNVRELGAFFGLTPRERSTGDRTDRGSITRAGDAKLRAMLIEGAWSAMRKDRDLEAFFHRVASRHPKDRAAKVAIVAVARKLTHRMYAVLTQRREYQPSRERAAD